VRKGHRCGPELARGPIVTALYERQVFSVSVLYMVRCSYQDPGTESEWNHWYTNVHQAEMLGVPGFRAADRYRAADAASPRYTARYELNDGQVLGSATYSKKSGGRFPEPWRRHITDFSRWLYYPLGERNMPDDPTSAGLFQVEVNVPAGLREEFSEWYDTEHMPEVSAAEGCTSARRYLPLGSDSSSHLILYDFASPDSLRRFLREDVPVLMRRYDARWDSSTRVANRARRAFVGRAVT
jgi:uncharacterized protein DUF4286